ncbi:MAG: hypothetical protein JWR51_4364 [Devosia sp.]|uniref:DUF1801 domain-containing protein n=1 Tax=Devosia sp. TaxID=1871048 RepID=UPI002616A323|nr:DUF1801 domain-containing protein [Devosia sp.]MDB5531261.1 hypothetical protein [Devosia sp.]
MDAAVAAVFEGYPAAVRERLLRLRDVIIETAANTAGVGALEETLKWGQVSYLTQQSGSGTTVRIDVDKASGLPAIYVNCQTNLVDGYREVYPEAFAYQGTRAVVIGEKPDEAALRHVIARALTYHARKKRVA